jgi:alkylation response protein AidB-like acyl-CoA dehydrogenase
VRLSFSDDDVEFREQARTWLTEHAPSPADRPGSGPDMRTFDLEWQQAQHAGGWAGMDWPTEYGGRGATVTESLIWQEEYARTGLPGIDSRFVGLSHAGPTLMARATAEQKEAHLAPILRGDVLWCQGFSEPEAGSDLAALKTRAVVDGDELVVTGQKIWTSYADQADWQELLVRTNHDVPKHKGITWVICDMRLPGIEVRPIRTMDGHAEFCEVFYDEVRIPLRNIVGDVDGGWSVAMSTLSFERGTAFTVHQVQLAESVEQLIAIAHDRSDDHGRPLLADEELARALARARADCAALKAMTYMGVSRNAATGQPGPEGSMLKLRWSELAKQVSRIALEVFGASALSRSDRQAGSWVEQFLLSFGFTIGGGTSEIQRNIIAERVLGLPR